MQVSVETLNGLERKVMISVPTEKFEEEVSQRLRSLAHKVKVDGFRPGKVPFNVVEKRFSESVRLDVAREMIQPTLFEALKEHQLNPAGQPQVEFEQIESGKDFKYNAVFEVFPVIVITELDKNDKVERIQAEVSEKDINKMIETLRAQNKAWTETERPVAKDDKIVINFEGFIDGKAFDGGRADGYELTLGDGAMIPGFEDGIIGAEKDKQFDLKVNFPEDYGHKELAGKEAIFKTTVTKISHGVLPELDDAFAEKFNIKEGGMAALKKDIKENMTRELERRLGTKNREASFDVLLQKNSFDLPNALIDQEIANLRHEMYHRVFGHEHSEDEKIPDFPRELFDEQAKRRVHLGLLFSEYVKKHEIIVDKARADAMIEKFASAYESPEELRSWYKDNAERMAEIEALVMEEMVADKIAENATVVEKSESYDAVMNSKNDAEEQGE